MEKELPGSNDLPTELVILAVEEEKAISPIIFNTIYGNFPIFES